MSTKSTASASTALTTMDAKAPTVQREQGPTGVMIDGVEYKVKQQVNVPILKHETGETVAVRIELPINKELTEREKEVIVAGVKTMATEESTINVIRVTELTTGQLFQLVLNAITASEFERAYPDNDYVGRFFAIKKLGLVAGKRYKDVQIVEIEPVPIGNVSRDDVAARETVR